MKNKSNVINYLFYVFFALLIINPSSIHSLPISDSTNNKSKTLSKPDSLQQKEKKINSDTTNKPNKLDIEKDDKGQIDSGKILFNKSKELIELKEKELKNLIESKEKEDGRILMFIFIIYAILFLIILGVLYYILSNKVKKLNDKIEKNRKDYNNFQSLNSSDGSFKSDFQETKRNVSKFESKLKEFEDSLLDLKSNQDKMATNIKATNDLNLNIQKGQVAKNIEVDKQIENSIEDDKGKYYNVEYYVESGIIKFRETDSGTPFYMQQFKNRSELTLDEKAYATTYSESIEKCFTVRGNKSGNYKNIKPGECEYDSNSQIWKLIKKGEVEGK